MFEMFNMTRFYLLHQVWGLIYLYLKKRKPSQTANKTQSPMVQPLIKPAELRDQLKVWEQQNKKSKVG